jgi:hypothetical protein
MRVKPMLGGWEIPRIAAIRTAERRSFAELGVPGRAGSVFQDLDAGPVRIAIDGSLHGDEARDAFLEEVRGKFRAGEPVTFAADIVTATDLQYVIVEELRFAESGVRPDQIDYSLLLRESPPPPPPPDPFGGLDAGLLDQAGGFLDAVTGALGALDMLGSIPDLGNPTEPLLGLLDDFDAEAQQLPAVLDSLAVLLEEPAIPNPSSVLDLQVQATVDFQGALSLVPASGADLLGGLPDRLGALEAAVSVDAEDLVRPLSELFSGLLGAVDLDLTEPVRAAAEGMGAVRAQVAESPLGQLALAAGEVRDLKEIVLAQAPFVAEQILARLTEIRDSVVPAETLQEILDFLEALETFAAGLPQDPEELAGFLARGFLGLPVDLLEGPRQLAAELTGRLDGLALLQTGDPALRLRTLDLQLRAAADLLVRLDVTDEAAWQLAIDRLTGTRTTLDGFAGTVQGTLTGLSGALEGIDLGGFATRLEAALAAIPEVEVTGLDELKERLLEPLRRLDAVLSSLTAEGVTELLRGGLETVGGGLDEVGIDRWREGILGLLERIRAAVEAIDLSVIRTRIEEALGAVRGQIEAVGADIRQSLLAAVEAPLAAVEQALDAIDLTAAGEAIDQLFAALQGALGQLDLPDLRAALVDAAETLAGLVERLAAEAQTFADGLQGTIASLGEISFDPVTGEVTGQIEKLTAELEKIDPAALGPIEQGALAAASVGLRAVDFDASISGFLLGRFDEAAALPRQKLSGITGQLDLFSAQVLSFDPEVVAQPLADLWAQLAAPVRELDAAAALQPLDELLARVRAAVDQLSPEQLREPLRELHAPLLAALDRLAPAVLLRPVVEAFDGFEEALRRIDLTALLAEVTRLLDDLTAGVRTALVGHFESLPEPLAGFLATLRPLLDRVGPSFLVDPVGSLTALLDAILEEIRPGDLFRPLQTLYDQLRGLLVQVPVDRLVAAFESVRAALVTALRQADPAVLSATVGVTLQGTAAFHLSLDPSALTAALGAPHRALTDALAALDRGAIPEPLRPRLDEVEALVAGLDPQPALAPLGAAHAQAAARLQATGTLRLDGMAGLAESFAPVRHRIDALIPDFLRQPVTADGLNAALDALRPDALATEVDAAFAPVRERLAALRPQIAAELQAFAAGRGDALSPFDLRALAARIQEIYDAVLGRVAQLDPAPVVAGLQGVFDAVRQQVVALDPGFLVDGLAPLHERIGEKVDQLRLDEIRGRVEALWAEVQETVDGLDPVAALRAAGVLERFAAIEVALDGLSITAVLDALDLAFAGLRAELEEELGKVQASFETMVDTIPSSVSVEISL